MASQNYYAMTDDAIAIELGQRLEQMRLQANIPQKQIADELGISEGTYRSAIQGKAKLVVIIGIMRLLGKLENLDNFLPETPFSPIQLLAREGRKRQRATTAKPMPAAAPDLSEQEDDESW